MGPEECEGIAQSILDDAGVDDQRSDPAVLAVAWACLQLCPEPGAKPHIRDGEIVYPASASVDATAFFIGHELAHDALAYYGVRLEREEEERAASRIACCLILPRRAFSRSSLRCDHNIATLRELWPRASPWIIARRIAELFDDSTAAQWSRSMRCKRRVGPSRTREEREQIASGRALAHESAWFLAIVPG